MKGIVYLVGAGPGDPGLLTVRARDLLATADVVVIDALVSSEIAAQIRPGARVVNVGKRASSHTLPQQQINQLLIDEAKAGRRVVRLKGGDPFVFGRGGEEAEELAAAGIPFEVVPGISSAIAGPAYAGIPVTHRAHATSLTIVTGHESEGSTGVNWPFVAKSNGTLVFLMGLSQIGSISASLIEHGMAPSTKIAVISRATTARQQTVIGTLKTIEPLVKDATLEAPALIVVGSVVGLHETINWHESKPLFGRTIVVTRAREQASELARLLEEAGARVVQFPAIEIVPPESWKSLDAIVEALPSYQWILFTSTNGVRALFERLAEKGKDARALSGVRVGAVGETTASELRQNGIRPDLVPEKFQTTALLSHFAQDQSGARIALIRAAEGREELIDELRHRGAVVDLGIAYQTRASETRIDELRSLIEAGTVDAVTFTSSSTVQHFFDKLSAEERRQLLESTLLVSIGPSTSQTLRGYGWPARLVEAAQATVASLNDAVVEQFAAVVPTARK